jgi:hypothetical protein
VIAESEMCERSREKSDYLEKLLALMQILQEMVATHEKVINQLIEFENAGEAPLILKYRPFSCA